MQLIRMAIISILKANLDLNTLNCIYLIIIIYMKNIKYISKHYGNIIKKFSSSIEKIKINSNPIKSSRQEDISLDLVHNKNILIECDEAIKYQQEKIIRDIHFFESIQLLYSAIAISFTCGIFLYLHNKQNSDINLWKKFYLTLIDVEIK
jgi:hypothetical protein